MLTAITETALEKCKKDYLNNWMPRKKICINLDVEEIKQLLVSPETEQQIRLCWHLKFYLRQLLLKTSKNIQPLFIKSMLDEIKLTMDFFSDRQTRCLYATLLIEYFMNDIGDFELYQMFDGVTYYDDYIAQITYKEYLRRKSVKK